MSTALNGIATDLARGLSIFEIDESLAALVMWPLDAVENVAKQTTTLDGVFWAGSRARSVFRLAIRRAG